MGSRDEERKSPVPRRMISSIRPSQNGMSDVSMMNMLQYLCQTVSAIENKLKDVDLKLDQVLRAQRTAKERDASCNSDISEQLELGSPNSSLLRGSADNVLPDNVNEANGATSVSDVFQSEFAQPLDQQPRHDHAPMEPHSVSLVSENQSANSHLNDKTLDGDLLNHQSDRQVNDFNETDDDNDTHTGLNDDIDSVKEPTKESASTTTRQNRTNTGYNIGSPNTVPSFARTLPIPTRSDETTKDGATGPKRDFSVSLKNATAALETGVDSGRVKPDGMDDKQVKETGVPIQTDNKPTTQPDSTHNNTKLPNNQQMSLSGFKNEHGMFDNRFLKEAHEAIPQSPRRLGGLSNTAWIQSGKWKSDVTFMNQQLRELLEQQTRASRDSSSMRSVGIDTVICVDTSASMDGVPLETAKSFINQLIDGFEHNAIEHDIEENVAMVTFGQQNKIVCHLTNDYNVIRDAQVQLTAGGPSPLWLGLALALTEIKERGKMVTVGESVILPRIILITDGYASPKYLLHGDDVQIANTTEETKQDIVTLLETCRKFSRTIDCIQVGNSDQDMLQLLSDGRVFGEDDVEYLTQFFRVQDAADELSKKIISGEIRSRDVDDFMRKSDFTKKSQDDLKELIKDVEFVSSDEEDDTKMKEVQQDDPTVVPEPIGATGVKPDSSMVAPEPHGATNLGHKNKTMEVPGPRGVTSVVCHIPYTPGSGLDEAYDSMPQKGDRFNQEAGNTKRHGRLSMTHSEGAMGSNYKGLFPPTSTDNKDDGLQFLDNGTMSGPTSNVTESATHGADLHDSSEIHVPTSSMYMIYGQEHKSLGDEGFVDQVDDKATIDDAEEPLFGASVAASETWIGYATRENLSGTVIGPRKKGMVKVLWSDGTIDRCRYGVNGLFDVKIVPDMCFGLDVMRVGAIVERGPDWKWKDQDGGPGSIGVVTKQGDRVVYVTWSHGGQGNYRYGHSKKYDVILCQSRPVLKVLPVVWQIQDKTGMWHDFEASATQSIEQMYNYNQQAEFVVQLKSLRLRIAVGKFQATDTKSNVVYTIRRIDRPLGSSDENGVRSPV